MCFERPVKSKEKRSVDPCYLWNRYENKSSLRRFRFSRKFRNLRKRLFLGESPLAPKKATHNGLSFQDSSLKRKLFSEYTEPNYDPTSPSVFVSSYTDAMPPLVRVNKRTRTVDNTLIRRSLKRNLFGKD
jgi:hypothetical protein